VQDLALSFEVSAPLPVRLINRQPRAYVRAVDGVSFTIPRGDTFALVGESGCGKSTVARLLVGLYRPSRGSIHFAGQDLIAAGKSRRSMAPIRRRLQMIFQDPYASLNARWRVERIVAEPLRAQGFCQSRSLTHVPVKDSEVLAAKVGALLEQVGLSAADGHKFPHEFSGGQRQRISIARALAGNPEFLVCDEPTSALDVSVQAQILNLMRDLQRQLHLTYLFISHDLAVVYHIADWLGVMYLGRLAEVGPARQIFAEPQHPYTRLLLDAIPDLEMSGRPRRPVAGEVPSPIAPPSGCSFHPRCPLAQERCKREAPAALRQANGVTVACHAVEEGRADGDFELHKQNAN